MSAIFRAPRLRDPRVVPTEPVEIDWTHPLAAGLVHLIVPGGARFLDDLSDTLAPMTLLGGSIWPSNLGSQIYVSNGSHGADVFVGTALPITTQGTFYTRGQFISSFYAGTQLYGVQDSTGYNYWFGWGTNTTQGSAYVNISGTSYGGPAVNFSANSPFSYGGTFASGSNLTQYVSGAAAGSVTIGAGNLDLSANTYVVLNSVLYNTSPYIEAIQALCALWRRALSADEMAWLDAEPFAMLRPKMRRRYFTVSSGSIITTRGILAAEWLATQQAKEVVATEMSGLLSRSSEVFAEFDQAVIRNDVMPLEIAVTAKKTATIPAEYDGAVLSVLPTPVEYLDLAATSEQSSLEYLGSTMAEGTIPAEWLATSVASAIVPIEWAGAALVTSGATIALEWMAPLSGGLVSSVEFLTALGTNVTLNADWSDAVLSNVTVTFETGKVLQVSDIVAADWAATLSAANIIPADWLAGRSISLTIPIEWTGSAGAAVQANALMPIEWAVASLIVPDWRFAVTFLPAIDRVGFQTPVDEIGFNEPIDEVVLI